RISRARPSRARNAPRAPAASRSRTPRRRLRPAFWFSPSGEDTTRMPSHHTPSCPALCRASTSCLLHERRGWPGIRAFTPVFDGLCPAMTNGEDLRSPRRLLRPAAQIVDDAPLAQRLARDTGVAAVQGQPVGGGRLVLVGDHPGARAE